MYNPPVGNGGAWLTRQPILIDMNMTDYTIRPIRNDEDHRAALAAIEALWDAEPGTDDFDRLDLLATLVEAYEDRPRC